MHRAWIAPLLGLVACATPLPEHARPVGETRMLDEATVGDLIPYRELSRDDFQAPAPPAHVAAHAATIGAFTCAYIAPDAPQLATAIAFDTGSEGYSATAPGLRFRGRMDRTCSWWNDERKAATDAYVLEHEQIHFAIVELEARRLQEKAPHLVGLGRSPEAAAEDLQRAIDDALDAALERALERSTRFDEDTSTRLEPERQAEWADEVFAELEERR